MLETTYGAAVAAGGSDAGRLTVPGTVGPTAAERAAAAVRHPFQEPCILQLVTQSVGDMKQSQSSRQTLLTLRRVSVKDDVPTVEEPARTGAVVGRQ